MVSISTLAFDGLNVLKFAEVLRQEHDTETGLELFFDTLPFTNGAYYRRYMADFIQDRRVGVHCPIINCDILADEGTLLYQYSIDRHEECLELAAQVNSPYMVLHTNSTLPINKKDLQRKKDILPERLRLLCEMAQRYGCELWMENVGFTRYGNIVADLDFYIELILTNKSFYSLIDLGHAYMNGWNIPALLNLLGERVRGLHVHDNDGVTDQHAPIFHGGIHWGPVFDALRRLPADCTMILEYQSQTSRGELLLGRTVLREKLQETAD